MLQYVAENPAPSHTIIVHGMMMQSLNEAISILADLWDFAGFF
jgi:hypothetical protein